MNFCKDCVHFSAGYCIRRGPVVRDPVSGVAYSTNWTAASTERDRPGLMFNRDRCGPDARHFVAKPRDEDAGREPVGVTIRGKTYDVQGDDTR